MKGKIFYGRSDVGKRKESDVVELLTDKTTCPTEKSYMTKM